MSKLRQMIKYSLLRHTAVYVVSLFHTFSEIYQNLQISYIRRMFRLTYRWA